MALGSGSLLHMLHFRHSKIIEQIDFGLPSHVSWSRVYVLSLSFQIVLESVNSTRKHWDRMWQELHHEAWFSHRTPVSTENWGRGEYVWRKRLYWDHLTERRPRTEKQRKGLGHGSGLPQLLRAEGESSLGQPHPTLQWGPSSQVSPMEAHLPPLRISFSWAAYSVHPSFSQTPNQI